MNTPEYAAWAHAKQRCVNPKNKNYISYGGRGIYMCPQWLNSFATFLADMGPRPAGLTLDRINVNGPYAPGNCRWASWETQRSNRRKVLGARCWSATALERMRANGKTAAELLELRKLRKIRPVAI